MITVIGGGSFGTVIADIVAAGGNDCTLWTRDAEVAERIQRTRENQRYLPGHRIHEAVAVSGNLEAAVANADLIFVTVPSASFRLAVAEFTRWVRPGTMLVSGTKGIEADGFKLMSDILRELCPTARVGVLSGPNLADEIAAGQFGATVIASADPVLTEHVQSVLHSSTFRVYGSPDMYGVELGGALKNIYAIVCGLAAELEVGYNTQALLITRALAEMSRFAAAMGANPLTFLGLAGVGDLIVTCTSPLSRNYQLGVKLGKGISLEEAMDGLGKLAEGVNTLRVVTERARALAVSMPLAEGLYSILNDGAAVQEVVTTLMSADQGSDVEFVTLAPVRSRT